jgi:hypothetical protein
MKHVGPAGFNGFLQGLNGEDYSNDGQWITRDLGVVNFNSEAEDMANFYGIYPESYQTSTRALPNGTLADYNVYVNPNATIFEPEYISGDYYYAGATFTHQSGDEVQGSFTAIGLARTPDIRISILGLLMHYRPNIYRSEFGASGTTRLVVLQIGQVGSD